MTPTDVERIHDRIDESNRKQDETNKQLSTLTVAIEKNIALCEHCRPKVLGNGSEGFEARLARIEEGRIQHGEGRMTALEKGEINHGEGRMTALETKFAISKGFLVGIVMAASAIGAVVSAIGRAIGH